MAALLRSGKFLRMVTGLPKVPQTNVQSQQPLTLTPITNPDSSGSKTGFEGQTGTFQTWSLQHFHSGVLPALGPAAVIEDEHEEVKDPQPLRDKRLLESLSKPSMAANQTPQENVGETAKSGEKIFNRTAVKSEDNPSSSQGLNLFKNDAKLMWGPELRDEQSGERSPLPELKVKVEEANKAIKSGKGQDCGKAEAEPESPPAPRVSDGLLSVPDDVQPHMVPVVPVADPMHHEGTAWYPLPVVCQMFRMQGRFWDLEGLLEGSRGIRPEDRKVVYFWTLQAYADAGMFDKAIALSGQLHLEGLGHHFPEYHQLMSSFAAAQGAFKPTLPYSSYADGSGSAAISYPASYTSDQDSVVPTDVSLGSSARSSPVPLEKKVKRVNERRNLAVSRRLKKALAEKNVEECLKCNGEMGHGKMLNVTEMSSLIELLVNNDKVKEATSIAERMLENDLYPMPKIFRFLLNRLASTGDVQAMTRLGRHLTSKVKKEISFDNRLCNAYLAAGRGEEYLGLLLNELDQVIALDEIEEATIQTLKDKFPRGGAMGLLESNPHLVNTYTDLAHKFLKLGYVAPMNVLWTYHFIGGRHDIASDLWEKYVKTCPQIMFQKVCQTARATSNADLAQRLVKLLEDASTVTVGARGIAHSCLLDVLTQRQEYRKGIQSLKDALRKGIRIEDLNRTALKRLKEGLEATTDEVFPFEIPKKSVTQRFKSMSINGDCNDSIGEQESGTVVPV